MATKKPSSKQLKAQILERHKTYYVLKGYRIADRKSYDLAIFLAEQVEKLEKAKKKRI